MLLNIEDKQGVVLKKGKNLKYVCVSTSKQEKMENFFFQCKDMIGHPFGTAFKVLDKKKLEIIDPILVQDNAEEYEIDNNTDEVTQDNRSIQDDTASQKLGKSEIMSLKKEGKTGEEIVQELVDNSATFKGRTEYSKAKYLKKKKKKYLAQFIVLKPSSRLLSEMYFSKNPIKVLEIRPDSLAQILTWSNVQANSNVLLMENCQGLLTGALMERLGLDGKLLQFYQGSSPVRIITEQFNYTMADIDNLVCSYPLDRLKVLKKLLKTELNDDEIIELVLGKTKDPITECKKEIKENTDQNMDTELTEENVTKENHEKVTAEEKPNLEKVEEQNKHGDKRSHDGKITNDRRNIHYSSRVAFINRQQRAKECLTALKYLREKNFTTLVIASKFHPKSMLLEMLEYLTNGCPFVVYFTHQEALIECHIILRELNLATNIEITETFLRNIQVLPNRSHPEIVMSATGGYILRGIKVQA